MKNKDTKKGKIDEEKWMILTIVILLIRELFALLVPRCVTTIALGPTSILSFGTASSRGAGRVTRDGAQSGGGVRTIDSRVRFSGAVK